MKPAGWIFFVLVVALAALPGCRTSRPAAGGFSAPARSSTVSHADPAYALVYIIHGDANYLYHTEDGKARHADHKVLSEAITVARKAKHGEVFIFHQEPERRVLWIFPRKDRHFLHYRSGQLIHRQKYSPKNDAESFASESALFNRYRHEESMRKVLLYFGHEIPSGEEAGYHHSRPGANFNSRIFARGAQAFLRDGEAFNLTVLSTCDNGSPGMVSRMQSKTKYLLASPQNLHLSHIDSGALLKLDQNPKIPTGRLAREVAESTFDRLSGFIQTAVTLAVYDMQKVGDYIGPLAKTYKGYALQKTGGEQPEKENTDCARLPFWNEAKTGEGVTVYYKPPRFGRKTARTHHSGWGCQQ